MRNEDFRDDIAGLAAVASHPFFRECYSTDGTLLDAMVDKLSAASKIQAERDGLLAMVAAALAATKRGNIATPPWVIEALTASPAGSLAKHDAEVEVTAIRAHSQTIMDTHKEVMTQALVDAEMRGYTRQINERLAALVTPDRAAEYRKTEPEGK